MRYRQSGLNNLVQRHKSIRALYRECSTDSAERNEVIHVAVGYIKLQKSDKYLRKFCEVYRNRLKHR